MKLSKFSLWPPDACVQLFIHEALKPINYSRPRDATKAPSIMIRPVTSSHGWAHAWITTPSAWSMSHMDPRVSPSLHRLHVRDASYPLLSTLHCVSLSALFDI